MSTDFLFMSLLTLVLQILLNVILPKLERQPLGFSELSDTWGDSSILIHSTNEMTVGQGARCTGVSSGEQTQVGSKYG